MWLSLLMIPFFFYGGCMAAINPPPSPPIPPTSSSSPFSLPLSDSDLLNSEFSTFTSTKIWPSHPVINGIGKTEVKNLKTGRINPFRIDWGKGTEKEQAEEIYAYFNELFSKKPDARIAITYSANTGQANDIYESYNSDKKLSPDKIVGANQALVFNFLLKLMYKPENTWAKNVHILPIPTMEYTNGGAKAPKMSDIEKALQNIETHLNDKWIVLGLQNQTSNQNHLFAIGGPIAGNLWTNTLQKKIVDEKMKAWLDKPGTPVFYSLLK